MAEISVAREGRVSSINGIGRAQRRVPIPRDVNSVPDKEWRSITRTLEKSNAEARDAARHLEEESMTDHELGNFYAVANHFSTRYSISASRRENSRKWANLALNEINYRRRLNNGRN